MQNNESLRYEVDFDPKLGKIVFEYPVMPKAALDASKPVVDVDRFKKHIDPYQLRIQCNCAACVDEIDGHQILKPNKIPQDVFPTKLIKKGNYAVAVVWSDGHRSSIYPFERLKSSDIEGESLKI
mmetsp:Transcript_8476/g.14243  ORF Transcript_8476/g.14243 Transcript_8476/m.14243 type:complete len:125 (-) Transcript_8476:18-392(-)